MPQHNTPRAQEMRKRNAEILRLVDGGATHREAGAATGATKRAVGGVVSRSKLEQSPAPEGKTGNERSHDSRALSAAGISTVRGKIHDGDKPVFEAMVAKAAGQVAKVKGEME